MRKSFTLIEILVAIFLLSLLIASAMFAFKLFIKRLNDVSYQLPVQSMSFDLLNRSIKGFYPYVVNGKYIFKFNNKYFEYISKSPVKYDGIVIARLECNRTALTYFESPLYFKRQNYKSPEILKNHQFKKIILDNLKSCKINVLMDKKNLLPAIVDVNTSKGEFVFSTATTWNSLADDIKAIRNVQ